MCLLPACHFLKFPFSDLHLSFDCPVTLGNCLPFRADKQLHTTCLTEIERGRLHLCASLESVRTLW